MRVPIGLAVIVATFVAAVLGFTANNVVVGQEKAKATAFDLIKGLAGDWTGTAMHANKEGHGEEVKVSYRVTSGGSAVVETHMVGSEHEMITVYHRDGDDLVLTHYCMLGNQPRMRTEKPAADTKKLAFKFAGGANIKSDKDPHMHDLTIDFLGADHIRSTWSFYKDGKAIETAVFDLKRKKK